MTIPHRTTRSMIARPLSALALAGAALALVGCGATQERLSIVEVPITSPQVALSVENFRGNVEVRVDPRLDAARIESKINADELFDEAKQAEVHSAVDVSATQIEQNGRAIVVVKTTTLRPGADDHLVNLRITMPRCDGLDISNRGGVVLAVDTAGSTRIVNREGPIEFRTSKPISEPVTLTTVDANIYYQVSPESQAAFDLETLSGRVEVQDRTSNSEKVYSTESIYRSQLNKGTNPVVLRTNRGDIGVWIIDDPVALTRVWKDSIPNPLDFLNLQGSQRFLRNLPEDHPEVQAGIDSDLPYSER